MEKYLGVDWGEKRIGLALAEEETKIATPFKTVAKMAEVLAVIKEEEINTIIIGSPKKMSGEEANSPKWLDFVARLEKQTDCRIIFLDERLSSLAADALIGNKKTKANRDEIAATIILQSYLDEKFR
ncbi:MAG: Holliday junction resolvase RuvX [Patescibacteria group bacterium]